MIHAFAETDGIFFESDCVTERFGILNYISCLQEGRDIRGKTTF